jgi:hypothetical protein
VTGGRTNRSLHIMGFRNEFFRQVRLPMRVRHGARAMPLDGHRDPHARSAEFPRFALELALKC